MGCRGSLASIHAVLCPGPGFNFLTYLQTLVGGESVMNPFLKAHCQKFAHSTVNSADWKVFFLDYMLTTAKIPQATLDQIDWDAWYNQPGMPPVQNKFDQSLIHGSESLAVKLIEAGEEPKKDDLKGWDSAQIVILLEKMIELQKAALAKGEDAKKTLGDQLKNIDSVYGFTGSKNSEIRFRWLTLAIRQPFLDRYPAIEQFLSEQGRMKYIRPLYRDLFTLGGPEGKKFAVEVFTKYRKMYHSIASKMVARDLEL
jgi:leukotriene-A4 hydrolase